MSSVFDIILNPRINGLEEIQKNLTKAAEKGLEGIDYTRIGRQYEKLGKRFSQLVSKSIDINVDIDKRSITKFRKEYLTQMTSASKKMAQLEANLKSQAFDELQKKQFQTELTNTKKILKEKEASYKKTLRAEEKRLALAEDYLSTVKSAKKDFESMAKTAENMGDSFGNAVSTFKSNLEGGNFGDIFKNFGKGTKGVGKKLQGFAASKGPGAGKGIQMLGKLGGVLGKIGPAIAAIGGLVAGLAAVGKVMLDANSQAKDFNKTLLDGVGAAEFYGKNMAKSLGKVRKGFTGIHQQKVLGMLAKDQLEVVNAFAKAGLMWEDMETQVKGVQGSGNATIKAVEIASTYSNLLATSATEMATQMAAWTEELGGNLNYIRGELGHISRKAQDGGFGVKRFYSMVLQASSGMAGYNVRLNETAGLLKHLSDSLGVETGGSFLQNLGKGFVNEDMQTRRKRIMLTGRGNTQKHFESSAENTGRDFASKFVRLRRDVGGNRFDRSVRGSSFETDGFQELMAGANTEKGMQKLQARMKKMSAKDFRRNKAILQAMQDKGGKQVGLGLARQFDAYYRAVQGSKGGLGNMAQHMDAFDQGGKLNMMFDAGKKISGKELYQMTNAQHIQAVADTTGKSLEEVLQLQRIQGDMAGKLQLLKEGDPNVLGDKENQIKKFNAYRGGDGNIYDQNGQLISSLDDYVSSQGKAIEEIMQLTKDSEDTRLSREMVSNTFDTKQLLAAGVVTVLESIYGVMGFWYKAWNKDNGDNSAQLLIVKKDLEKQNKSFLMKRGELERDRKRAGTMEEKDEIQKKIDRLDKKIKNNEYLQQAAETGSAIETQKGYSSGLSASGTTSKERIEQLRLSIGNSMGRQRSGDLAYNEIYSLTKDYDKKGVTHAENAAQSVRVDSDKFTRKLETAFMSAIASGELSTTTSEKEFVEWLDNWGRNESGFKVGAEYVDRAWSVHDDVRVGSGEKMGIQNLYDELYSSQFYGKTGNSDGVYSSAFYAALPGDGFENTQGYNYFKGILQESVEGKEVSAQMQYQLKKMGADDDDFTLSEKEEKEIQREEKLKKFMETNLAIANAKEMTKEELKARKRDQRKNLAAALYGDDQRKKRSFMSRTGEGGGGFTENEKSRLGGKWKEYAEKWGVRLDDFFYTAGKVHPINPRDDISVIGGKSDGALAQMGRVGGQRFEVIVHNYGDENKVLHVVQKALKKANIMPNGKKTIV